MTKNQEQPLLTAATAAALLASLAVTPAVSSPRRNVPPLMSHEERQALMRRPFPIVYIHPVKRWGGVQIVSDESWMEDANAWKKKYAQEGEANADAALFNRKGSVY